MATLRIYPNVMSGTSGWTNPTNVTLYDTLTATHSGAVPINAGIGAYFQFPMDKIPAGSTINAIRARVNAHASATGRRSFYSVALRYMGGNDHVCLQSAATALGTSAADATVTMTRAQLLAVGFDDSKLRHISNLFEFSFISNSATSTTLTWSRVWIEVDFDPPVGFITELTLGLGSNSGWTTPEKALGEDGLSAERTAAAAGMFAALYFTDDAHETIPQNAIIRGLIIEVDYQASVVSSGPTFWLKGWSFSDGVYSVTPDHTARRRYVFGDYNNPLMRTRSQMSEDFYLRFAQSTATSTKHSIDHVSIQVWWELPASGHALFFGENF